MAAELKRPEGFAAEESFAVEWHTVPGGNPSTIRPDGRPTGGWREVCVLRVSTRDGIRVIRREDISGISRLPTGAVHRPHPTSEKEDPVYTTVVIYGGQAIALGGTKYGTSGALHLAIEKAWLGDGFNPDAPLSGATGPAARVLRYALKEVSEHKAGYRHAGGTEAVDALSGIERMLKELIAKEQGHS